MMTIIQLKERRLIDKDEFIRKLKDARCVVTDVCDPRHRDDNFEHPMIHVIDAMINLIEHQDEVKIE